MQTSIEKLNTVPKKKKKQQLTKNWRWCIKTLSLFFDSLKLTKDVCTVINN